MEAKEGAVSIEVVVVEEHGKEMVVSFLCQEMSNPQF